MMQDVNCVQNPRQRQLLLLVKQQSQCETYSEVEASVHRLI